MGFFDLFRSRKESAEPVQGSKRLKIKLMPGWLPMEMGDGPVTYYRERSKDLGALQFSTAEYKKGEVPNPTDNDLMELCRTMCERMKGSKVVHSKTGACNFGQFATMVMEGHEPTRFQLWVV